MDKVVEENKPSFELHVFPVSKTWNSPNISPYCVKAELALLMAHVPFKVVHFKGFPRRSTPNGKLPYLVDYQPPSGGKPRVIADSEVIVRYLRTERGIDIDSDLSTQNAVTACAIKSLVEDRLNWVLAYYRWGSDRYWPTLRELFFGKIHWLIAWPLAHYARRIAKADHWAHGLSRHREPEIDAIFHEGLQTLSSMLGEKRYLFGDRPCSADASVFGLLVNIMRFEMTSHLTGIGREFPNLVEYTERMMQTYFPKRY
jgi:glutathione S-transferase